MEAFLSFISPSSSVAGAATGDGDAGPALVPTLPDIEACIARVRAACGSQQDASSAVEAGSMDELAQFLHITVIMMARTEPTTSSGPAAASNAASASAARADDDALILAADDAVVAMWELLDVWGAGSIGAEGVPSSLIPDVCAYIGYCTQATSAPASSAAGNGDGALGSGKPGLVAAVRMCGLLSGTPAAGGGGGVAAGGSQQGLKQRTKYAAISQQLVDGGVHTLMLSALGEQPQEPHHDALQKEGAASVSAGALLCLRNLARAAKYRGMLADANAIPVMLAYATAPAAGSSKSLPKSAIAGTVACAVTAVEGLINLGCLFENKQKIVDAGAGRVLVGLLKPFPWSLGPTLPDAETQRSGEEKQEEADRDEEKEKEDDDDEDAAHGGTSEANAVAALREAVLACMGCLTFFFEPGSAAFLDAGVLNAIAAVLASSPLLFPLSAAASPAMSELHRSEAQRLAAATVVSATDLVKNLMLGPAAQRGLLAAGKLAELLMACIADGSVPTDARNAAMQSLRMVCAGDDGNGLTEGAPAGPAAAAAAAPAGPVKFNLLASAGPLKFSQPISKKLRSQLTVRDQLDARGFKHALGRCVAAEAELARAQKSDFSLNINDLQPESLKDVAMKLLGVCPPCN